MSKPPFIIPTIKGHELWPTVTRTPAAVRIQILNRGNMNDRDMNAARIVAMKRIQNADGIIKQMYLKFRQSADLGSAQFNSRSFQLAEGVVGQFTANGAQEIINILVDGEAMLPKPKPEEPVNPEKIYVIIRYDWDAGDFESFTRVLTPRPTPIIGSVTEWFFTGDNPYVYKQPILQLLYQPAYGDQYDPEYSPDYLIFDTTILQDEGAATTTFEIGGVYDGAPNPPVTVTIRTMTGKVPKTSSEINAAYNSVQPKSQAIDTFTAIASNEANSCSGFGVVTVDLKTAVCTITRRARIYSMSYMESWQSQHS